MLFELASRLVPRFMLGLVPRFSSCDGENSVDHGKCGRFVKCTPCTRKMVNLVNLIIQSIYVQVIVPLRLVAWLIPLSFDCGLILFVRKEALF